MIIDILLETMLSVITTVFSWLNIPQMNPAVVSAANFMVNMIGNVSAFLKYVYSEPLYLAIVAMAVVLLAFDQIYHLVMFILRKLSLVH